MILKNIIFIIILSILSSCVGAIAKDDSFFAPKPLRMGGPDKAKGSPEYLQGWDDGCKTGLSTMVPGYYKSFYKFKQDPYMINNSVYYKSWKDAYTYCRQYSFRYAWDTFDRTYNKSLENPLCIICENELGRAQ